MLATRKAVFAKSMATGTMIKAAPTPRPPCRNKTTKSVSQALMPDNVLQTNAALNLHLLPDLRELPSNTSQSSSKTHKVGLDYRRGYGGVSGRPAPNRAADQKNRSNLASACQDLYVASRYPRAAGPAVPRPARGRAGSHRGMAAVAVRHGSRPIARPAAVSIEKPQQGLKGWLLGPVRRLDITHMVDDEIAAQLLEA